MGENMNKTIKTVLVSCFIILMSIASLFLGNYISGIYSCKQYGKMMNLDSKYVGGQCFVDLGNAWNTKDALQQALDYD
jgi:hypothetical protein